MAEYTSLMCRHYIDGPINLFPGEHLVTFRSYDAPQPKIIISGKEFPPEGEAWCIVKRSDVTLLEDGSGLVLVSLQDISKNGRMMRIGIFNAPNDREDSFVVPFEDMPFLRRSYFRSVSRE